MPSLATALLGKTIFTVFPLNPIRVMVFTHILHQPTRYKTFPNNKLGEINVLEHNLEIKLFRGDKKCSSKCGRKYWIFTFLTRFDYGHTHLGVNYP